MRSNVQEAVPVIEEDLIIARDLAKKVFGDMATVDNVLSILSLLYTEMSTIVVNRKLSESATLTWTSGKA